MHRKRNGQVHTEWQWHIADEHMASCIALYTVSEDAIHHTQPQLQIPERTSTKSMSCTALLLVAVAVTCTHHSPSYAVSVLGGTESTKTE